MTTATAVATGDMAAYGGLKRRLIRELEGEVLELGAGRGANFAHLGPAVSWTGLEPRRTTAAALRRNAQALGIADRVLVAPAEDVPLPDGSVDAVLATIVLCSVKDQQRVLAEVRRVLRPEGRFVFFEHVAAPSGSWTHRAQSVAAPFSRAFDHGCDPVRGTASAIEAAGFASVEMHHFAMRGPVRTVIPFIAGHGVA